MHVVHKSLPRLAQTHMHSQKVKPVRLYKVPDEQWPGGIWQSKYHRQSLGVSRGEPAYWAFGSACLNFTHPEQWEETEWEFFVLIIIINAVFLGTSEQATVRVATRLVPTPLGSSISPDAHINTCTKRSQWANPLQYKARCQPLRQTHTNTHVYARVIRNMLSPITLLLFSIPIKRQKRPFISLSSKHILYLSDLHSALPCSVPSG